MNAWLQGTYLTVIRCKAVEGQEINEGASIILTFAARTWCLPFTRQPWRVTSLPGLADLDKATGRDLAGMIIEYIVESAKPGKARTKGRD